MTRNRKDTMAINLRVDVNLIDELMAINPSLITKDPSSGKIKFRHGALGRYVARLVREDLNKRTGETSELQTFIENAKESGRIPEDSDMAQDRFSRASETGGQDDLSSRSLEDEEG